MALDPEQSLHILAEGRSLEATIWPQLLELIIPKIEAIATEQFPIPTIPLPHATPPSTDPRDANQSASPDPHEPPEKKPRLSSRSASPGAVTGSGPTRDDHTMTPPPGTLPPQLLSLIKTIQSTLQTNFPTSPPHTSQRLAELILQPKRHYKSLPSYLRALDRIVTVASPISAYPLPTSGALGNNNTNALFNGTTPPAKDQNDKDFIGGAELTPIPWLRDLSTPASPSVTASDLHTESTSMIDGPNGAGSIETVSVNMNGVLRSGSSLGSDHGVTQGELIRQEQEAGITPIPTGTSNHTHVGGESGGSTTGEGEGEEEQVHARGPNLIGMEDLGPQAAESGLAEGIQIEEESGRKLEGDDDAEQTAGEGSDQPKESSHAGDGQKGGADAAG